MSKNIITILSIDPGLSTCGYSVLIYNKKTKKIYVLKYGKITSNSEANKVAMKNIVFKFGKRLISLNLLRKSILKVIVEHKPDYIAIEGGFFNKKFPNAFIAIIQCIHTIEQLAFRYFNKPVYKIAPKLVKKIISDSGDSGKVNVQKAIFKNKNIKFKYVENIENLSEHEADSIAIGYCFAVKIYPELPLTLK